MDDIARALGITKGTVSKSLSGAEDVASVDLVRVAGELVSAAVPANAYEQVGFHHLVGKLLEVL